MNAQEFLTEASLSFTGMQRDYLVRLAKMVTNGTPVDVTPDTAARLGKKAVVLKKKWAAVFRDAAKNAPKQKQSVYVDLSKFEELKQLTTVDGETISINMLNKSDALKGVDEGKGKSYNLGNIGEIALGVAAGARFLKLGEQIDYRDVLTLSSKLQYSHKKGTKGQVLNSIQFFYQDTIKHTIGKVDNLDILIVANSNSAKSFIRWIENKEKMPEECYGAILSSIHYINNNNKIISGINKTSKDKNTNSIKITSDGISGAATTKADLYMNIDQERINILSVKTAESQLGQASGHDWENQARFFKTVFGVVCAPFKKFWGTEVSDHMVAIRKVYQELVIPKCAGLSAGNSTAKEKQLIKLISDGVVRYSNDYDPTTGKIDLVDVVKLGKNPAAPGYKLMKIDYKLSEALQKVNLITSVPPSGMGVNIHGRVTRTRANGQTFIKDVPLCRIWSGPSGMTFRTALAGGSLLDEMAEVADEVETIIATNKAKTKAKSNAIVKPAVAPQAKAPAKVATNKLPTTASEVEPELRPKRITPYGVGAGRERRPG